jgi:uncharacterized membrane protein
MMSQNRQAAKDRLADGLDYEVNLKAELEIMRLHKKLDSLKLDGIAGLLEEQKRHLALLLSRAKIPGGADPATSSSRDSGRA